MRAAIFMLLLTGCAASAIPEQQGEAGSQQGHLRVGETYVAATTLSFSNVRVAVEETMVGLSPWRSRRRLSLTSATGARKTVELSALTNGGGNINFYALESGNYLFLGERDCVELDAVRFVTRSCIVENSRRRMSEIDQRCAARRSVLMLSRDGQWPIYLGRFDWMNGYDPPDGRFGYAFRFQTLESAMEDRPDCSPER